MKSMLGITLSAMLAGCTVTPRKYEPPYEWKTVEGLKEQQACFRQCPTPNSCHMSYLDYCVKTARQLDMMYAEMKKSTH